MVKEMLSVLMDGIKDSNMLMDYAEECDSQDVMIWFINHTKKRIEELGTDYAFIKTQIGLDQRVREGDAIAEALESHIEHEMENLKERIKSII